MVFSIPAEGFSGEGLGFSVRGLSDPLPEANSIFSRALELNVGRDVLRISLLSVVNDGASVRRANGFSFLS